MVKSKRKMTKTPPSIQAGNPPRLSQVEMTEIILPSHTNQLGSTFGGQIMAWIDIAGSIAASRHAKRVCVTASIDALHFLAPVGLGQFVKLLARVNYAHKTSMEVGVRLEREDPRTGEIHHVATAYLTFVALDDKRRPTPVPSIVPETPTDRRRFRDAELRREARLRLKKELMDSRAD